MRLLTNLIFKIRSSTFAKKLINFASAQVFSNLMRMLTGFIIVKIITPEEYGLFSGIGVYLSYIHFFHIGIINGLNRELPFEIGRNNNDFATEITNSVFGLTFIISIIVSLIYIFFAAKFYLEGEFFVSAIIGFYSISAFFFLLNKQFLPVLYYANNSFERLSKQNIFIGIINLGTVPIVYWGGIYGLGARTVIVAIYEFYLLFKNKPQKLHLQYKLSNYKLLIKTGFPIFSVGYVGILWTTVLNNIIFTAGGSLYFGYYALSMITNGAFSVIPVAISDVIYPRMSVMLGKGDSIKKIIDVHLKALFLQFLFLFLLAIIGYFLLPIIVPLILPKYSNGIKAAQWIIFLPVISSLGLLNSLFNVLKKQFYYFISLVTGSIIGIVYIVIRLHFAAFDLVIFPQGLILGTLVQNILGFLYLKKLGRNESRTN